MKLLFLNTYTTRVNHTHTYTVFLEKAIIEQPRQLFVVKFVYFHRSACDLFPEKIRLNRLCCERTERWGRALYEHPPDTFKRKTNTRVPLLTARIHDIGL